MGHPTLEPLGFLLAAREDQGVEARLVDDPDVSLLSVLLGSSDLKLIVIQAADCVT
jgi:hypothetical protein